MAGNIVPIHGKICRIDDGGTPIDYSVDWSISVSLDIADASRQGQHWKESVPGQAGWSGSMTFHFVAGNVQQKAMMDNIIAAIPGTKLTDIKFQLEDTGDFYSGDIWVNGFSTSASVGDVVNCSFDFTGEGLLTLTVA